MKLYFRLSGHSVTPGRSVVEVFRGEQLLATIYANESNDGVRVISKYLTQDGVAFHDGMPAVVTVAFPRIKN
jgi:hypothetical protein